MTARWVTPVVLVVHLDLATASSRRVHLLTATHPLLSFQVLPADGRPLIRLTKCTDDAAPSARLPPSKAGGGGQGPAGGAAPIGGATPAPQLSPMANRYTPLQPIRRSSESGAPNSNHP